MAQDPQAKDSHAALDPQGKGVTNRSDTLFVGSLEKGFRVLRVFRQAQRDLGLRDLSLTEIAKLAELDKSAAQRFTNTLVTLGYLNKNPRTRRYSPAIGLADFYYTYILSNRIAEIAMPRMIEASKRFDTTVNLCELSGSDIVYTIRIPHEKARYEATVPGRRVPAFCAAGGVVILANLPAAERDQVLTDSSFRAYTDHTITDLAAVYKRIDTARGKGFDIGESQIIIHELSTAAPVFNSEGRAVAALQIPVYQPDWTLERTQEKIVPLAIETARAISYSL
ncbi:IclR family transcriptional regulator [Denitrobaculum tricleocarpae]|uniref:IclR family transcriptional regulator n=1 Tax=Denitrobaculum tricleocarpae TaxID=2591009 RepID=A0A545TEU9_9PROT|nr:IclR family transcriptional regulator [Denitrobaculum tricleocarpae]TQV75752.1 IclR family transcriptional regulator [Denitrobaculum tricleocarpae]